MSIKEGPEQETKTANSTASPGEVTASATLRLRKRKFDYTPYLLLVPATLFLAIFFIYPMIQSLIISLQDSQGGFTFDNINTMIKDVNFGDALRNTLLFIVVIVPLQVVLALIMALVINTGLKGAGAFLYIWTIPLAISDLAAGIVWLAIFTERGYINSLLKQLGLIQTPISFLSFENPTAVFVAVVIAELWRATSIVMVILVAGLQVIPKTYSEAAEIFGASPWQRLRYVILPLLKPSLQVALILRTILAFQTFAIVVALAGRALPVLAGEAYNWYNGYRNVGVAAAYALLILILSIANTFIYLRFLQTKAEQMA
jgi:multiple sugar transport system permease protein